MARRRYDRYDWEALRQKFLLGDYKSLREFAEREGLKYNGNFREKTKGWDKEKGAKEEQKRSKIIEGVIEGQIKREIDWNLAHLEAWGGFLNIVRWALKDFQNHFVSQRGKLNPYALEKAASVLKMVQEGQRKALGLDEKSNEENTKGLLQKVKEIVDSLQPEAEDIYQEGDEEI